MRRILAGLVLAAVFAMHGIPLFAGGGMTHEAATSHEAFAVTDSPGAAVMGESSHARLVGALPGGAVPETAPAAPAVPDDGSHVHFWAACLAVLFAGMTLLVAAVVIRWADIPLTRRPGVRLAWPRGWARIPRPPDLFALCLLRT